MLAIDLFEYMGMMYFTCVDIFSRFYYAAAIESKEQEQVEAAYEHFVDLFARPEMVVGM